MVDFSYSPEVLRGMVEGGAYGVLVIDHHKSAVEKITGYDWSSWLFVDMSDWQGVMDWNRYQQNIYQDHCENSGGS